MPGLKFATGLGMMVLTIIIHALFMVGLAMWCSPGNGGRWHP